MEKKLPSVFANKLDKKLENFQESFYSANERKNEIYYEEDTASLDTKINRIFNSCDHVYKSKVMIETDRGIEEKEIVGKRGNSLITMDNEIIEINEIKDIRKI